MIWLAVITAPLFAAMLLIFRACRTWAIRLFIPLSTAPALAIALFAPDDLQARLDWLLLGTHFGFGDRGRVMLLLTALLWTTAGVYGASYVSDARRVRFFVFFALCACGNLGLTVSQDLASFYLFFGLMTFSAYGLIVHNGDPEAYRAGRVYLVAAVFAEVLLLTALVLLATEMETLVIAEARAAAAQSPLRDVIIACAFVGFGVKAGAALVHFWLPLAHPVAPTPASAVLSGAMIKAGLLGWLHFLPLGAMAQGTWAIVLLAAGGLAAFGGAAIGLTQRDPKTVLAYSSVSQMGVITAALGVAFIDPGAWPLMASAVAALALNHALAKGALFLGVGIAEHTSRAGRKLVLGALTVATLAIAGAPWTAGALAKHGLKAATHSLDSGPALAFALSLSSVATTALLAHFIARIARVPEENGVTGRGLLTPWLLLTIGSALLVPLAPWLLRVDFELHDLDVSSALWPVATGVALYAAGSYALRGRYLRIPPGDMVVLLERCVRRVVILFGKVPVLRPAAWQIDLVHYMEALAASEARRDFSRRAELRLMRWSNAGLAFACMVLVFAATMLI